MSVSRIAKKSSMQRQQFVHRLSRFLPASIAFSIALLCGLWLFAEPAFGNVVALVTTFGLDTLRSELIAALFMTLGAALLGAIVGRRIWASLFGAIAVFVTRYLYRFVRLELQPVYDPGGHLEPLNTSALFHTGSLMLALAFLCAFAGAAVGVALHEVVLRPFGKLVFFLKQRLVDIAKQETQPLPKQRLYMPYGVTRKNLIVSWLAVVTMMAAIILSTGSSDLFLFSPDTGLHSLPVLAGRNGATRGTVIQDSLVSTALGGQRKPFLIYLPPSYTTPAGRTKHYPVLYLLHGVPGTDIDWIVGGKADQSVDTLIALGKIPELILVLPDGNGRKGVTSEWGNSFDRRQQIENYVAFDLVKYVDSKYRTIPQTAFRGIGGLSMGGFGATNIAVHHPDIFRVVISLGGYYRAEGGIWGNNRAYMQANSPLTYLPSHKNDWTLQMFIGGATNDQPYYADSKEFVQELSRLHVAHRFDIQRGAHSWRVWQVQLYNALLWLHWT